MALVYTHNYSDKPTADLASINQVSDIEPGTKRWYDVQLNGNKIGYAMMSYNKSPLGYVFKDYSLLRMPMAGVMREVLLDFYAVVDKEYSVKSFTFGLASGDYTTDIFGGVQGGFLEMDVRTEGEPTHIAIPLVDGVYLPGMVPLLLASRGFPAGEFGLTSLDPFNLAVGEMVVRVIGKESIKVDGDKYETNKIEIENSGMSTTMFVLDDGTVVKEIETAGMEMHLTSREKALDIPEINPDWDILKSLAVGVDRELDNPREAAYMKVELQGIEKAGFNLEDDFQNKLSDKPLVIEMSSDECAFNDNDTGIVNLDRYLKPENFIQSDDLNIIRQALLIIKDMEDDRIKARAIADWVYSNIEKDYAISLPSATDVLRVRRGDCNEHSALYTALARAAGIPTKICLGVVYSQDMFYYHAWPAVYLDGCWIAIDPTLGQEVADATHIMLLQGGYDAQASLMRIVGKLQVKVLEYKTSTRVASTQ